MLHCNGLPARLLATHAGGWVGADEDLRRNLLISGIIVTASALVGVASWLIWKKRGERPVGCLHRGQPRNLMKANRASCTSRMYLLAVFLVADDIRAFGKKARKTIDEQLATHGSGKAAPPPAGPKVTPPPAGNVPG